jgi:hypothetical protein
MAQTKRKTLYFTAGSTLTDADVEAMNNIPGGAFHRNAAFIQEDDKLEPCDAVAGPAIPPQYRAKYRVVGEDRNGDGDGLNDMRVDDLRRLADERGIEVPAGVKKTELLELLRKPA